MSLQTAIDNKKVQIAEVYSTLQEKRCVLPAVQDIPHLPETIRQLPNNGYALSATLHSNGVQNISIGLMTVANGLAADSSFVYSANNAKLTGDFDIVYQNIDQFSCQDKSNAKTFSISLNGQTIQQGEIVTLTSDSLLSVYIS